MTALFKKIYNFLFSPKPQKTIENKGLSISPKINAQLIKYEKDIVMGADTPMGEGSNTRIKFVIDKNGQ